MNTKQVYRAKISYTVMQSEIYLTKIEFCLTNKRRLQRIIWYYKMPNGGIWKNVWGDSTQEKWNLDEANGNDLKSAFKEFALKSPEEFKVLYDTLKKYDDVTFPYIKEALREVQETFNFN
ncbi:MAG: hypothetical protein HFJ28_06210 [Clostridia bacterium]|nr:hypothetical protein [Clostridia bacterium]